MCLSDGDFSSMAMEVVIFSGDVGVIGDESPEFSPFSSAPGIWRISAVERRESRVSEEVDLERPLDDAALVTYSVTLTLDAWACVLRV